MEKLINIINDVISELPEEFSTHELIILLAKNNQHAYIEALYEEIESSQPFKTLHGKIGKYLSNEVSLVEHKSSKSDADIFGSISST